MLDVVKLILIFLLKQIATVK